MEYKCVKELLPPLSFTYFDNRSVSYLVSKSCMVLNVSSQQDLFGLFMIQLLHLPFLISQAIVDTFTFLTLQRRTHSMAFGHSTKSTKSLSGKRW